MPFARKFLIVSAAVMLIASGTPSSAQTAMAPGPALPSSTYTGGIGLGGTFIAPGPALGDGPIEQEGPGGIPLAAGPQIATQPLLHRHHRATHNAIRSGIRRTSTRHFQ
jgi:hypothetical protein